MTLLPPALRVWLLVIAAFGAAFAMACQLAVVRPDASADLGVADRLLGGTREAVSRNFFNTADLYFHKGVAHRQHQAFTGRLFQRLQASVTPEGLAHAEGDASAELLPWLNLACRTDPHNVEAFLVAAFWADSSLRRGDIADSILKEAQRLNPKDYRIPQEIGHQAIRHNQLDKAGTTLSTALTLQDRAGASNDKQVLLDRAELLVFLAFLDEIKGDTPGALRCFKNALAIFPDRAYIRERIEVLESGRKPDVTAQSLLARLTRQSAHDSCQDHADEHGHNTDHDHEDGDGDHTTRSTP